MRVVNGLILSLLVACSFKLPSPEPGPDPVPQPKPLKTLFPDKSWEKHAHEEVLKRGWDKLDLKDEKEFCPQGLSANGAVNFVAFLSAIVKHESNFRPSLEYKEKFHDRFGNRVISTGLFQISHESTRYSYKCMLLNDDLKTGHPQLKDPLINISCAIHIMDVLFKKYDRVAGKIDGTWQGGSRYWAVLRSPLIDRVKSTLKPLCR